MKISELRATLAGIELVHGDIQVAIDDADTNWHLELKEAPVAEIEVAGKGETVVLLGGDYESVSE